MKNIAKIAIIKPLHSLFDYEIPEDIGVIEPGSRVSVEFGKRIIIGVVVHITKQDGPSSYKLKKILEIIDKKPLIDKGNHRLIYLGFKLLPRSIRPSFWYWHTVSF